MLQQIIAGGQVQELGFVQVGESGEVEVGQLLDHRETSRFQPFQQPVLFPLVDFLLG